MEKLWGFSFPLAQVYGCIWQLFFGAVLFIFGAYSVLLANISLVYVIK